MLHQMTHARAEVRDDTKNPTRRGTYPANC
jgi:hypothetical protein